MRQGAQGREASREGMQACKQGWQAILAARQAEIGSRGRKKSMRSSIKAIRCRGGEGMMQERMVEQKRQAHNARKQAGIEEARVFTLYSNKSNRE
jgi:hypothetical protein